MKAEGNLASLPKWAARKIEQLQRQVEELDKRLGETHGTPVEESTAVPGDIGLVNFRLGSKIVLVPRDTRVRFFLPNPYFKGPQARAAYVDVYLEKNHDNQASICLQGDQTSICVQHNVSNMFYVFYPPR